MEPYMKTYTLSGRTCMCVCLAFRRTHVRGSLSAASLVICSTHCTVQYVELRGYCPVFGGGGRVTASIVRSWLWSTATIGAPHWAILQ